MARLPTMSERLEMWPGNLDGCPDFMGESKRMMKLAADTLDRSYDQIRDLQEVRSFVIAACEEARRHLKVMREIRDEPGEAVEAETIDSLLKETIDAAVTMRTR